jgi:hypothetical protein
VIRHINICFAQANERTSHSGRRCRLVLPILAIVVAAAVAVAAPAAEGAFNREALRQLTGTPTGPSGGEVKFVGELGPQALTSDAAGDVWISEIAHARDVIDEFEQDGTFVRELTLGASQLIPESLAFANAPSELLIAGEIPEENAVGVEVRAEDGTVLTSHFPEFDSTVTVAVDNSTNPLDPAAGDVYVVATRGAHPGIKRFNTTGEPLPFSETKTAEVAGSGFNAVSVDSAGDIYVFDELTEKVEEFAPGGAMVREISGNATPGLGGDHQQGGWGGTVHALAFDPQAAHVLVAVGREGDGIGGVDEFSEADGTYVAQDTSAPGPSSVPTTCGAERAPALRSAFAVAASVAGDMYVADDRSQTSCEHAVDVYGPGRFVPLVKSAEPGDRTGISATLRGEVDPDGQGLTSCVFEVVTVAAFESSGFAGAATVPCLPGAGEIGSGPSFVAVTGNLTGLTAGDTYEYRLVATTAGPIGGTATTGALAFTAPAKPAVTGTVAGEISSEFATLQAEINPLGSPTTYFFEIVSAADYDAAAEDPYLRGTRTPVPSGEVGEGGVSGDVPAGVEQEISRLSPGTEYHFRVVASNGEGESAGEDTTFVTAAAISSGLPDGRAYELVTPSNKGSAADMFGTSTQYFNQDVGVASATGSEYLMTTTVAAFGVDPASDHNAYVFRRTPSGWETDPLSPSGLGVQGVTAAAFDPDDFSRVALLDSVGSASSTEGSSRTSINVTPAGPEIVRSDPPAHQESEEVDRSEVVGASGNLGVLVIESKDHSIAAAAGTQTAGSTSLYEWSGSGECVDGGTSCPLVNVSSGGAPVSRCGAVLGQGHTPGGTKNSVSAEGTAVVFTAPDPYAANGGAGCWNEEAVNAPQVYVRRGDHTLKVSEPEAGVTEEGARPVPHAALFVGASEDDRRIFFVTRTELTPEAASLHLHDQELYECELNTEAEEPGCVLTRVSRNLEGGGAEVKTVPAVSADGSMVYFTASAKLAEHAPPNGTGQVGLYRFSTGSAQPEYVATVDQTDYTERSATQWPAEYGEISLAEEANWYTTPDGRYLLFASARELDGHSTEEAAPGDCPAIGAVGGNSGLAGHCAEIYRFDATNSTVICVSCSPTGAKPTSNAQFASRSSLANPPGGNTRPLSDDGSYAFFDTADSLLPRDTNETLDVYEWHDGTVGLISSGKDAGPSFFVGASADGANVFFGTHAQLTAQDTDSAGDLYDARIGGGFSSTPTGVECEGDSCQNPPAPPSDATPGSLTFSGVGNLEPPVVKQTAKPKAKPMKCKKGFLKMKDKCVKRTKKNSKRPKKSAKGRK